MKQFLIAAILMISLLLFVASCKIRKVATTHTETTSSEVLTKSVKKDSIKVDTGKIHTQTNVAKNVQDSSQIIIQTDTGIQKITIPANGNFTYTGRAKSIIYKKKTNDHSITSKAVQDDKAISTHVTKADSSNDQKQLHQVTKSKITDSKPSYAWIWVVLIGAAVVAASIWAIKKFKPIWFV